MGEFGSDWGTPGWREGYDPPQQNGSLWGTVPSWGEAGMDGLCPEKLRVRGFCLIPGKSGMRGRAMSCRARVGDGLGHIA